MSPAAFVAAVFLIAFASFCAFSGVLLASPRRTDKAVQGSFATGALGYFGAFALALAAHADTAALVAAGGFAFCLYSLAKERKRT